MLKIVVKKVYFSKNELNLTVGIHSKLSSNPMSCLSECFHIFAEL